MREARTENKILPCYFILTAELYARKGRKMRGGKKKKRKKTVTFDYESGN
jgi:hypothetical protein